MKTIYKCEKCGREFDTYEECMHCEYTHLSPEKIVFPEQCNSAYDFKYDEELPCNVVVAFHKKDENGNYMYTGDENNVPVMEYAEYELVRKRKKERTAYAVTIQTGVDEYERKEKEWWENWQREHAEQKEEN